jgi:hypothetical protein
MRSKRWEWLRVGHLELPGIRFRSPRYPHSGIHALDQEDKAARSIPVEPE